MRAQILDDFHLVPYLLLESLNDEMYIFMQQDPELLQSVSAAKWRAMWFMHDGALHSASLSSFRALGAEDLWALWPCRIKGGILGYG
ncbi:hypothetical protein TNCV_202271 [Trichonephila clavipes]|nr:hypothetical protein TNCV_202271 [Trichonephila clavipes]